MILPTAASMAVPPGTVCAAIAMGRQLATRSTAISGRAFFRTRMVKVLSDPDVTYELSTQAYTRGLTEFTRPALEWFPIARGLKFSGGRGPSDKSPKIPLADISVMDIYSSHGHWSSTRSSSLPCRLAILLSLSEGDKHGYAMMKDARAPRGGGI